MVTRFDIKWIGKDGKREAHKYGHLLCKKRGGCDCQHKRGQYKGERGALEYRAGDNG